MKTNDVFKWSACLLMAFFAISACKKDKAPVDLTTKPEIVTDEIKGQNIQNLQISGIITNSGGTDVTQCGFVWSNTQTSPTLEDKVGLTEEGPHSDIFSSIAIAFNSNTSYYVRAYATNAKGTSYGEVKLIAFDYDANLYHTVKIGNQIWMLENLNTSHFSNGASIPYGQNNWVGISSPAFCQYNDAAAAGNTYGFLYNYYAVNNAGGLAPAGWHVPNDADWQTLADYLGGNSVAGNKLKETGLLHWANPNLGTNESGFTALPGGFRDPQGVYSQINTHAYWWTSTGNNLVSVNGGSTALLKDAYNSNCGLSIRCLKNP